MVWAEYSMFEALDPLGSYIGIRAGEELHW